MASNTLVRFDRSGVERPLPHNEELERGIVQQMLEYQYCVALFVDAGLSESLFRRRDYRIIVGIIFDLRARGIVPAWHLVRGEILRRDVTFDDPLSLEGIVDAVPRPIDENIPLLVAELRELAAQRRLLANIQNGESPTVAARNFVREVDELSRIETAVSISESLPEMLARRASAPPRECLLPELLALGEIALVHGQPRDGKTWIVQELAVALVTGTSALHWDRFRPLRPARVMYITNEDGEGPTATRFQDLLDPRGLDVMPSELRLIVGRGCSFDDPVWQRKLIADIKAHAIDVVIADPLRSLSGAVDQGPRELQPLAAFLRRLVRETGCALLLVHHDVKPQAGTPDTRRRAQRSSGGGLFSIVDSPMHVERIDELRSVVTPDGFKHSADPAPFIVRREHGDGWTRIVGEPAAAGESTEIALQERIVEYLRMTPGASGSSVAAGVRTNKQLVYRTLEAMCTANTIDAVRERRGTRWFMKETV